MSGGSGRAADRLLAVGYAAEIIRDYFRRTGRPGDNALDACYQYEMTVLRDTLSRLEVILDDEGVPREVAIRVIRCMVYGSPSPAAAEERMRREAETVKILSERPPAPLYFPDPDGSLARRLGLPKL